MGRHTACEKSSCLYKFRDSGIFEDMCSVCQSMEGRCRTYFTKHNIEIRGVCHILHPYLLPTVQREQKQEQEQEETNSNRTENIYTNADKENKQ